jgi:hypothetical protein
LESAGALYRQILAVGRGEVEKPRKTASTTLLTFSTGISLQMVEPTVPV